MFETFVGINSINVIGRIGDLVSQYFLAKTHLQTVAALHW